jgi:fibronectin type 3 domain-containing protein
VSAPADSVEGPLTAVALGPNDNGFSDTTAQAGAVYEYRIRSVSLLGAVSEPSAPVRIAVPLVRPVPPGNARAAVSPAGVALAWDAIETEGTLVRVYRYRRGTAPAVIGELPAAQRAFTDREAQPGTRYFYFLVSVRDGVESDRGNEMSVRR